MTNTELADQFLFPDSPTLISLDRLSELDKAPPGTYLAQSKVDGRRRMVYKDAGVYTWRAKNRDDSLPVPADLKAEFEALPWPDGIGLDCEWYGPRDAGSQHKIFVFDLLKYGGESCFGNTFISRIKGLEYVTKRDEFRPWIAPFLRCTPTDDRGFVKLFAVQKDYPFSEGLVIRKASSTIIGHRSKSVVNPEVYKVKFERATR